MIFQCVGDRHPHQQPPAISESSLSTLYERGGSGSLPIVQIRWTDANTQPGRNAHFALDVIALNPEKS